MASELQTQIQCEDTEIKALQEQVHQKAALLHEKDEELALLRSQEAAQSPSKPGEPRVVQEVTQESKADPPGGYVRPVFILGPMKDDINDMLMQEFPDKFARCVPHTTRPPQDGEVDGRDFYFVSMEQMRRDFEACLFIEAGKHRDTLYGTSIKAIREVTSQGKHCILRVADRAIRRPELSNLLPTAVCIKPSSPDVIQSAQPKNTEEQCKKIYELGQRVEKEFAGYFTAVVEGDSLADIYTKVKDVIHEQSKNCTWVPYDWEYVTTIP